MKIRHACTLTALLAIVGNPAAAQQDEAETQNCISLFRIDHTDVVDDQTILFHSDGAVYRNTLPHSCPGLDSRSQFMYRVQLNQLCNVDLITVLEDVGSRFIPGASCGLGKFEEISEDTAARIVAEAEAARSSAD